MRKTAIWTGPRKTSVRVHALKASTGSWVAEEEAGGGGPEVPSVSAFVGGGGCAPTRGGAANVTRRGGASAWAGRRAAPPCTKATPGVRRATRRLRAVSEAHIFCGCERDAKEKVSARVFFRVAFSNKRMGDASARARLAACPAAEAFVKDLRTACLESNANAKPANPAVAAALSLFDLCSHHSTRLCLSHCPGRLDVLGGVTDVFGGLSLQAITSEGTLVVVQAIANKDHAGSLRIVSVSEDGGGQLSATLPLVALAGPSLPAVRAALDAVGCPTWALYVAGAVAAVAAAHPAGPTTALSTPLSILISSNLPRGSGLASSASLCTAVAAAVSAALAGNADGPGFLSDKNARRALVQSAPLSAWRAETGVAGAPCGPADQAAVWRGAGGALLPVDCGTDAGDDGLAVRLGPTLRVPAGWALAAVASGPHHSVGGHDGDEDDDAPPPYHAARAAGFMAAQLLPPPPPGDGNDGAAPPRHFLCARWRDAPPPDFDSLPATLTGAAWAAGHGGSTDVGDSSAPGPLSLAHPYPVRAAAAHAVGDAARTWAVRKALEGGAAAAIDSVAALGEGMAASHAGYTAIGLGHAATDAVRAALLAAGPAAVGGARVSGGGAGGAVVALVADSPAGWAAVDAAAAAAGPWGGGGVLWAAPAGAPGGAGFGVIDLRVLDSGQVVVVEDDDDEWGGL